MSSYFSLGSVPAPRCDFTTRGQAKLNDPHVLCGVLRDTGHLPFITEKLDENVTIKLRLVEELRPRDHLIQHHTEVGGGGGGSELFEGQDRAEAVQAGTVAKIRQ